LKIFSRRKPMSMVKNREAWERNHNTW
jgi:hypothetical protein